MNGRFLKFLEFLLKIKIEKKVIAKYHVVYYNSNVH